MSPADWMRVVAVALTAVFMGGIVEPITAHMVSGARRVWLYVASIELFMFSCAGAVIAHFGERRVVWYRTPIVLVAATLGLAYLVIHHRDVKRGQQLAARLREDRRTRD
jgi:succinate dehydrogenase hydrophobic anchor subunit